MLDSTGNSERSEKVSTKSAKTCQQNKCEKVSMEDVDSTGNFKSVPKSVIKKSSKSVNKISV